jgi:hypothetical protein
MARASKRLAGAGRSDHQHALGDLPAELLKLGGITQEVDDLHDLFLRLFGASHVGKGDLDLIFAQHARTALGEGHGTAPAGTALHLPHKEDPQPDQNEQREPVDQNLHQHRGLLGRSSLDLDVVIEKVAHQSVVAGAVGGEVLAVFADAFNGPTLNRDLLSPAPA